MLPVTTASTFSTSELQKVLRHRQFFTLLTSKCASRHNVVHFSTSQLPKLLQTLEKVLHATTPCNFSSLIWPHAATWLRARRFSEPTFRPSGATKIIGKHRVSQLFYLFARLHLLALPTSVFPSVHIVGSWTTELPCIFFCLLFANK